MTPEIVDDTIRNYLVYLNDFKRLTESLQDDGDHAFNLLGIGLSSKEERTARRIEELERRLTIVVDAIDRSDLTPKEWTVVDCAMDGKTMTWIAKEIFGRSHQTAFRLLSSAVLKISNYINEAQAS